MLRGKVLLRFVLFCIAIVFIVGLFGCGGSTPTEAPTEAPEATEVVEPTLTPEPAVLPPPVSVVTDGAIPAFCGRLLAAETPGSVRDEIERGMTHIPNQLIFTGDREEIATVIDEINETTQLALTLITAGGDQEIDLTDLLLGSEIPIGDGVESPVIQLYQENTQPPENTVETLAITMEVLSRLAVEDGIEVFADLNYVIPSPWDVEGSPWDVEGSPWDVEGSPWDVEGSNAIDFFVSDGPAAITSYLEQAAVSILSSSYGRFSGEGWKVVILDSSPFRQPGYLVTGVSNYKLCVIHPENPAGFYSAAGTRFLSQHGYYIGGLAYLTAPESELFLLRALEDGTGDLFTVLKIIVFYMKAACDDTTNCRGALDRTVFNMSFGFRPENVPELTDPEKSGYRELINRMWDLLPEYYFGFPTPANFLGIRDVMKSTRDSETQIPVVALSLASVIARDLGGTVVAASGNSSATIPGHRFPDIPARLFHVLGVPSRSLEGYPEAFAISDNLEYRYQAPGDSPPGEEATYIIDSSGGILGPPLACYSNFGSPDVSGPDGSIADLVAPGGDGQVSENPYKCEPSLEFCQDGRCMISTIYNPDDHSTYLIYWAGTSFATALYSGMVASGGAP